MHATARIRNPLFLDRSSRRCVKSGTPMTTSPRLCHQTASMIAPQPLLPPVILVGLACGIYLSKSAVSCQLVFQP